MLVVRVVLLIFLYQFRAFGQAETVSPENMPPPEMNEVQWLVEVVLDQTLLELRPFDFLKDVDREDSQQRRFLDFWHSLGLLAREEIRFVAIKEVQGSKRKLSIAGYRYSLAKEHSNVGLQGFIYGLAILKKILNVSMPHFVDHSYFSKIAFEWYITQIPEWVRNPMMQDSYRELRRALESEKKPFERRLYLEYQDDIGWILWQKKPSAMKKSLF